MTNLTLYSNNSEFDHAKAGDLINITLEVSENIYNATLEILNTTINMTESTVANAVLFEVMFIVVYSICKHHCYTKLDKRL